MKAVTKRTKFDLVFPNFNEKFSNREINRKFKHESQYIENKLKDIEESFINDIFSESVCVNLLNNSYINIYKHHLEFFIKTCDWISKYGKLRFAIINLDYFYNNYFPIEKEPSDIYDTKIFAFINFLRNKILLNEQERFSALLRKKFNLV